MQSINYIVTAKHYSEAEGAGGTVRGRILKRFREMMVKNRVKGVTVDIDNVGGNLVTARIYQGSWIADCPDCRGAEFVDPDEPIFFCCTCINRANSFKSRPVTFPDEPTRKEIERLILARPVNDVAGVRDVDRANCAQPLILVEIGEVGKEDLFELRRDWLPHETITDLTEQNKPIAKWKKLSDEDKLRPVKSTAKKAGV